MGKRERRETAAGGRGPYWKSMLENLHMDNFSNEWIQIRLLDRSALGQHPWNLVGGGAAQVLSLLEISRSARLRNYAQDIGIKVVTRSDDSYLLGSRILTRKGVPPNEHRNYSAGNAIRDWQDVETSSSLWPYDELLKPRLSDEALKLLWPLKAELSSRVAFGKTQLERGLEWFEYSMAFPRRLTAHLSISWSGVASHNHFTLDRSGKIYKRAESIFLASTSSEAEYVQLLGLLNSSVACFWLRQHAQQKGGAAEHSWSRTYEMNGAAIKDFPIPPDSPRDRALALQHLAKLASQQTPAEICTHRPTRAALEHGRLAYATVRHQLVATQEELDWEVYGLYGLVEGDYTYAGDDRPEVRLGERAFEIVLARKVAAGDAETAWFYRHGSTPVTDIPDRWPRAYRDLVQRRIDLIESDPAIGSLEAPDYKRRWAAEPWADQQEHALRKWLLDRLEDRRYWFDAQGRPTPRSIAQLADLVARDAEVVDVLGLWEGAQDVVLTTLLTRLLVDEAVPYLAAYRLKESGLRKRETWEQTWDLQRREDAGEKVGPIPVPPKYTNADFRKASWWHARGKLDVPKERFVLYPDAGRSTDPTALLGWGGWDHAQQSLALSIIMGQREAEGWDDRRLVPLVAGLAELQPWVEQWHAGVDPTYGMSMAAFCRQQLADRIVQVGKTIEELEAWRPAATTRGRKARI